jgi:hypothetical protein
MAPLRALNCPEVGERAKRLEECGVSLQGGRQARSLAVSSGR